MSHDISSPLVLITGAAKRVGAAIANHLHQHGARVILHYNTSEAEAQTLADQLNAKRPLSAFIQNGDLSADGVPEQLAATLLSRHGHLDALVNNASSFFPTPIGQINLAAWNNLIGSNLKGPLFLSQTLAPALRARQGAIVNIIDIHAERPLRNYSLYCAAKAGLAGLTRALALEFAPEIRVNGIAPGAIEWPEDDQFSSEERNAILEHIPLKKKGNPADIAQAVIFLLFHAPYVTGQILGVDGGRSIHL